MSFKIKLLGIIFFLGLSFLKAVSAEIKESRWERVKGPILEVFKKTDIKGKVKEIYSKTGNDFDKINDQYKKFERAGYRLPNYPKSRTFINKCLKLFSYPARSFKIKNLGLIKKIDKNDKIIPRKKATKDPYDIVAYDLMIKKRIGPAKKLIEMKYRFYYLKSKLNFFSNSEKNPLIVISPSIKGIKANGMRAIETKWAKEFALNGMNSIIMSLEDNLLDLRRPLLEMDEWLAKEVVGTRLILDFAKKYLHREVDMNSIGAIGASLGGLRTAIFMGIETKRIKSGVLVAAGGNFPDLWTTSEQKLVKKYRGYRIKKEKIPGDNEREKLDYIYQLVKKNTCSDPIIFASRRSDFADDVKVYVGTRDKRVPTKNQLELWAAMGRPRDVRSVPKHKGVIWASANVFRGDIARFFNSSFGY